MFGTWLLIPPRAVVEGCHYSLGAHARVTFQANHLWLAFGGSVGGPLDTLLLKPGGFGDHEGLALTALVDLQPPIEPGTYNLEGKADVTSTDRKLFFQPGPRHDLKVKRAGMLMISSAGSGPVSQQQITGTLTIEVASETELRGRLELQSVGDFCGALTRAKISSPFALKLVSRSDAVPEGY